MGLLPLEFAACLEDSPLFRETLHAHEKELERTAAAIKDIAKEIKAVNAAAKVLSACQRRLSARLIDFKFECIGQRQTDDEIVIAGALKEFGKLIAAIEDEKERMLERAGEQFVAPLDRFRRDQLGAVRERKKKFEKHTAKFYASQERHLNLSVKKQDYVLQEADATLEMEQRDFVRAGLDYVDLIQEVQERKKFEFVETLLCFVHGWLTFYHQGYEVANDFQPHMLELQARIQKTRENFNASREDIQALMRKMLDLRNSKPVDRGSLNKHFTRTGYLFLMEKKKKGLTSSGSTCWNKYYCHYQRENRVFNMIPYTQTTPKIVSNETFRLKSCVKRVSESIDKRFCFDIVPEDKPGVVYTFQALSEEDRQGWLDAMDGKEAMYVHPPRPSDAHQTFLDEAGFNFVARCMHVLESRGLEEQGLYRVAGVSSKVIKLLSLGLDRKRSDRLNLSDPVEWENKTMTSAIKTYLRNLPEPLMTFKLHPQFLAAAKMDTYEERLYEVQRLVSQLPEPNKRMLEMLTSHLDRVSERSPKNMMTASNLGVCFGPTILRCEEETVAAIMEIKFANVVAEIVIENWRQIFLGESPKASVVSRRSSTFGRQLNGGSSSILPSSSTTHNVSSLPVVAPSLEFCANHHQSLSQASTSPNNVSSLEKKPPLATKPVLVTSTNATSTSPVSLSSTSRTSLPQRPPPPYQEPPPPMVSSNSGNSLKRSPVSMPSSPSTISKENFDSARDTSNLVTTTPQWYRPNHVQVRALSRQHSNGASSLDENEVVMSSSLPQPTPRLSKSIGGGNNENDNRSRVATTKNEISEKGSTSSIDSFASVGSSNRNYGPDYHVNASDLPSTMSQPSPLALTLNKGILFADSSTSSSSSCVEEPTVTTNSPKEAEDCRKVRTLYACVAEHESELSFEPNVVISNVRPSKEPGWLEGELGGRRGMIPANYVEFIT